MTNAERLVLLKRARSELQRVRDELNLTDVTCSKCAEALALDPVAKRLEDELDLFTAKLETWILYLAHRAPTSERVSAGP